MNKPEEITVTKVLGGVGVSTIVAALYWLAISLVWASDYERDRATAQGNYERDKTNAQIDAAEQAIEVIQRDRMWLKLFQPEVINNQSKEALLNALEGKEDKQERRLRSLGPRK